MHRAAQAGGRYELPALSKLLSPPEFDTLRQFLVQGGVDPQQLQAQIDQLVEQTRQEAAASQASDSA